MKLITLTISLCWLLNVSFASATDWQSNPSKSRLNFAPSYEGMPINGRFGIFSVTYTTDAKDQPIHLSVKVSIASADMDNSDINEAIGAADWFNITDFPEAQFMITGVLGPKSNAHGPNEFLHIDTGKRLTSCVAQVLEDHFER